MDIRIAGVANDSIVDGDGLRFSIFVQGCPHHCEGCHNPQTHNFSAGKLDTIENLFAQIISNPLLDGVTFSGGEPFCHTKPLYELGKMIKEKGYNIVTYTGYTFEYLLENADEHNFYKELLSVTDYLVDGKFEIDKKRWNLRFIGSSNQRYLDCQESLRQGKAVEFVFA